MTRICYHIDESMTAYSLNSGAYYQPAIVRENEDGFYPTDYNYGSDFKLAKQIVADLNKELGLTQDDVFAIVTSSMFPASRGRR